MAPQARTTPEIRQAAVAAMRHGIAADAIAQSLGVTAGTVRRWLRQADDSKTRRDGPATVRRRLRGDGLEADDELRIGPGIAYLLLQMRRWVHRRVELFQFLDADNVQRQMSVDFTLPTLAIGDVAEMQRSTGPIVPLTMLAVNQHTLQSWTSTHAEISSDRVHLYEHGRSRETIGDMRVHVRAELVGLPTLAPALALLTAVVLLVLSARSSQVNKEAGATLLLIGPTLLSALLAAPGEHAMATRLLRGTRGLVAMNGLASFAAALALAGSYGGKLCTIWTVATVMACVSASLLIAGFVVRGRIGKGR